MATVFKRNENAFLTIVRHKQQFLLSKIFPNPESAQQWGKQMDKNVSKILSLSQSKLSNMSPQKIEQLGGMKLFKKLTKFVIHQRHYAEHFVIFNLIATIKMLNNK